MRHPFAIRRRSSHPHIFITLFCLFAALASVGTMTRASMMPAFVSRWFASAEAGQAPAVASWRETSGAPVVHASGRGRPWVNLQDGLEVHDSAAKGLDAAEGLSAATGDFDEDGVPDLVAGYRTAGGGAIAVSRGNVDAIFPNAPEAQARKANGTFTDAPFLPGARSFVVPAAVEMLGAGDFNADGHMDLIAGARGANALYWMRGDGKGGFADAIEVELPGKLTTLAVGEIDATDGLEDVLVGVARRGAASLLVYRHRTGAFNNSEPESLEMPGPVTSISFGQLDDRYELDAAVAAGGQLVLVHGKSDRQVRPGTTPPAALPRVDPVGVDFKVAAVLAGDFAGDRKSELALLGDDGAIRLWSQTEGMRAWSALQVRAKKDGAVVASLVRARTSTQPHDDLVVVDPEANRLSMLLGDADPERSSPSAPRVGPASEPVDFDVDGQPAAVATMRLNPDPKSDLVVVRRAGIAPIALTTAPLATFTVNSTLDTNDSMPGDGVCDDGGGNCTLRAAITEANALSGTDTINFGIGSGQQTINVTSFGLPPISEDVTIDGTTQPGFSGTPLIRLRLLGAMGEIVVNAPSTIRGFSITESDLSGIRLISSSSFVEGNYIGLALDGTTAAGNSANGVTVTGSFNTIGGSVQAARNIISANGAQGIQVVSGGDSTSILGNYIGTNAAGMAARSNHFNGIEIVDANSVMVGGTNPGEGNVISGNDESANLSNGVYIHGTSVVTCVCGNFIGVGADGSTAIGNGENGVLDQVLGTSVGCGPGGGNVISGNGANGVLMQGSQSAGIFSNMIGTNAAGTAAVPNGQNGILFDNAFGCYVGDPKTPGFENVVSGNTMAGITFNASAFSDVCVNAIGVGSDFSSPIPNGLDGIRVENASDTLYMSYNTIQSNTGRGVNIVDGSDVSIGANSIFNNGNLGIDLGNDGPTPNDLGDGDTGPNNLQNFPVVTSAVSNGFQLFVDGTLNSEPDTDYIIDVFVSPSCDSSGSGEGLNYVDTQFVTTDGSGNASFSSVTFGSASVGDVVTTTATMAATGARPEGVFPLSTSEFSQCVSVTLAPADLEVLSADGTPDPVDRDQNITYTFSVASNEPFDVDNPTFTVATPPNTTFVSFTPEPGWSASTPPVGGTGTIMATTSGINGKQPPSNFTLVVKVNTNAPGGAVTATGTIMSPAPDPVPGNNSMSATVNVPFQADLALSITDSPDPVLAGSTISYVVMVHNNGPDAITEGSFSLPIPDNTTFFSITEAPTWTCTTPPVGGTGTVDCSLTQTPLASGATATFTIVVQVVPELRPARSSPPTQPERPLFPTRTPRTTRRSRRRPSVPRRSARPIWP